MIQAKLSNRRTHPGAKLGRPQREFSPEQIRQIEEMALHQAKDDLIATVLGVEDKVFRRHFRRLTAQKRAEGRAAMLQAQYNMRKQVVMAIWLGKQHLEQSDKADLAMSGSIQHDVVMFGGKAKPKPAKDEPKPETV